MKRERLGAERLIYGRIKCREWMRTVHRHGDVEVVEPDSVLFGSVARGNHGLDRVAVQAIE